MARVIDIDAVLNQPPAQRYSGPEAIARRDEMLCRRALLRQCAHVVVVSGPVREGIELTNKDLGT